ncbi:MAG: hypothetical protein QOI74_3476, partial [Micromonosporaceae bacterium]|nr:hypothetical protein [Micromonosporaceae bacterium]
MTSDVDPGPHRPRHSAADQNAVSTTILPRFVDDPNPWAPPVARPEPPVQPAQLPPVPLPLAVPSAHPVPAARTEHADDAPTAVETTIDPTGPTIILAQAATTPDAAAVDPVAAVEATSTTETYPTRMGTTQTGSPVASLDENSRRATDTSQHR